MGHFESMFDLYRQMAANIPDCSIYIFDHDFDYLLAEGEEVSKLGVTSESLIGCNFFEVWPQEVTMMMSPYYLETLKGKRQKLEQTTDEGVFIQHFIPIFDKEKEVVAGMVVSQNVSILREVKEELSARDEELESKQRLFETVINTVGEGIMVSNLKGEILLVNPAAEKLLGMSLEHKRLNDISENLIVKKAGETELKNEELPFGLALRGARLDGYDTQVEFRNSDRLMHIENSARPLKTGQNEVEGAVLVMRDVTSRKELEKILEENLVATKTKSARLEHFVKKLSHNLLGPTANLNILYSLLEKSTEPEEREAYISKIGEVAKLLQKTASEIGNSMLAFTHSQDQWGINRFESAVEHFVKQNYNHLDSNSITLSCDFGGAKEVVYPTHQFDIIFTRILKNVLKLCKPNTQEVFLRSFMKNEVVGLSIKAKVLQPLCEETQGLKDVLNKKSEGICEAKEQIEALGGKLKFEGDLIQIIF